MAIHWKNFMGKNPANVLAMKIPKGQIKGFFKKEVIIEPGEAAVLIKDGRIEEELTQTKLKNFGGGFGGWLERVTGKGEDELLLFVDTNTMDLELPVKATSKDHTEINGTCTVRCQVNVSEAIKIIGAMEGKDTLTKTQLQNRIQSEMATAVLSNKIANYSADEFHGNINIIKDIETSASIEMRKTFELWGLKLIKMYTNWDKNAFDELMEYRNAWELYDARKDVKYEGEIKEMEKNHGILKKRAEQAHDQRLAGELNEIDVKRLWEDYAQEVDKRRRMHEIMLQKEEKKVQIEIDDMELKQDNKEIEEAIKWKDKLQRQKMEKQKQEVDQQIKMYQGMQLESKKVDASIEKERIRMEPEKAKSNLEIYEKAQEIEKKHQLEMVEQMAKLTQAAKPDVPQTLVQGGSPTPVVSVQTQEPQKDEVKCPSCDANIQAGMTFCPSCGTKIE